MIIRRKGLRANHGERSITLSPLTFQCVSPQLAVSAGGVSSKDFTNSACHTYSVVLSQDEIQRVLSTLASAAMAHPEAFARVYGGTLPALVQLQAVVAGVIRSAPGRAADPTVVEGKR